MGLGSDIEWTDATWNPVTGCTKISPGCKHCYAERMSVRLKAMGQPNYRNGFAVTLHPEMLDRPLRWRAPRSIFVNSMSDLFHDEVPLDFIRQVFAVMAQARQHRFQILTKRSARLAELSPRLDWPENVGMGVSMENAAHVFRIDHLRQTGAQLRFLSVEPLLGPLPRLELRGIDWIIAGGESGPHARPMDPAWIRGVRDQCTRDGVAFFFKQWGGANKKRTGRVLEGRTWDEIPERARPVRGPTARL